MSCFGADLKFCPECGNVLPPSPQVLLKERVPPCVCSPEFSGQEIRSTVTFNPEEQSSAVLEEERDSELKGPVIDRRCSRCHREGMIYHTRQMRSADEGQTVFFTCVHCRFQEKEDS
uniref:DNA-directed RNA polymerase subunit n=1 Tax=Salarias fasciatus TaxID=181472 RepID=A0A672H6X0_SALFA